MSSSKKGKKFKEKKAKEATANKDKSSSPIPKIIYQAQNSDTSKNEKQGETNEFGNSKNQFTIIMPEKKEKWLNPQNILGFSGIVISMISVYIASQANKQVAEQFETANKPVLQAKEFKIRFIDEDRKIRFEPTVTNYGNHPIKTVMYRISVLYDTLTTNDYHEVKFVKPERYQLTETYFMKEKPDILPLHTETHLPQDIYEGAWNGLYNIYLWGEIIYENMVTNKRRRYEFVVRMKKLANGQAEEGIMFNKNEDVSKSYRK